MKSLSNMMGKSITFTVQKPKGSKENNYLPRKGGGFYINPTVKSCAEALFMEALAHARNSNWELPDRGNALRVEIEIDPNTKLWDVTVTDLGRKYNRSRRYDLSNQKLLFDALQGAIYHNDIQVEEIAIREKKRDLTTSPFPSSR